MFPKRYSIHQMIEIKHDIYGHSVLELGKYCLIKILFWWKLEPTQTNCSDRNSTKIERDQGAQVYQTALLFLKLLRKLTMEGSLYLLLKKIGRSMRTLTMEMSCSKWHEKKFELVSDKFILSHFRYYCAK